jgi:LysR family glycine cleavage system transcriptional activator
MTTTSHLKSLQALDMALREGSLKAAAERLAITPAAVGQRIRALEDYLGMDLIARGRSGLVASPELEAVLPDLRQAFAALDRVTQTLNFERTAEVHIISDIGFADQWLVPRLAAFRALHPTIHFCVNGVGDVPSRIGSPDLQFGYGEATGEDLFTDSFLPVTGPDNLRRVAGWNSVHVMEGMPLLHVKPLADRPEPPGWVDWFDRFGQRMSGQSRGVHYSNMTLALDAARQNVGFLVTGVGLVLDDLQTGRLVTPFPPADHLRAPHAWRMRVSPRLQARPQSQRLLAWIRSEAQSTAESVANFAAPASASG